MIDGGFAESVDDFVDLGLIGSDDFAGFGFVGSADVAAVSHCHITVSAHESWGFSVPLPKHASPLSGAYSSDHGGP